MTHELFISKASRGVWIVRARYLHPRSIASEWFTVSASRSRLLALMEAWWKTRQAPSKEQTE